MFGKGEGVEGPLPCSLFIEGVEMVLKTIHICFQCQHTDRTLAGLFFASALEACSQLGGQGLEPFYSLIEGGREGEFFAELEEYFYYALLKRCVC